MTTCSVEGCPRRIFARGVCTKHYSRLLRYGDPSGRNHRGAPRTISDDTAKELRAIWERHAPGPKRCEMPGCDQARRIRGLCLYHRAQLQSLDRRLSDEERGA